MLPILFNLYNILFSKEECIEFLLENEILYQSVTCTDYHRPMIRYYAKWKCLKRHTINQGQSSDTLFFKCKLPCNKVLLIDYLWLTKSTSSSIQKMTGHSTSTITKIVGLFRQLVASDLDEQTSGEDCMIGSDRD